MLEKLFTEGGAHTGAHLGFFSGIGMITPVLSKAWELGIKPWIYSPGLFTFGMILIVVSIIMIAFTRKSLTKVMRTLGWMLIIPGILAILFTAFGQPSIMGGIHNAISGAAILVPVVDFLIEHSVPQAAYIGMLYIAIGLALMWTAAKIYKASDFI